MLPNGRYGGFHSKSAYSAMDVSRYNFLCQKALHQGLQYAKSFGHQYLETEHVALAMLRSESITLGNIINQTVSERLKSKLSQMQKVFGNVKIKFGMRLDKALDQAEEKAGEQVVEEELLWACLLAQSTLLQNLMLDAEQGQTPESSSGAKEKQAETKQSLGPQKDQQEAESAQEKSDDGSYKIPEKLEKVLATYTQDLTALAERGELDPVVGRDMESRRVLEILGRKKKNNPILIGEAGVGKTAVAEAIALRIAEGRVPEPMQGKRVLSLDLGALVAGAKFRGEFEDRMKNLLKAIRACAGGVILFIDEIHMLVGAGSADGSADAANLMKPALARGELRCLGASTLDEYRTYIEKDPALERRFQEVLVEEPSRSIALSIMRGIKGRYEVHHGVQINDEALVSAVDLSMRFLPSRRLPDKAIDLLDEACSRLRLQIDSVPTIMDELRSHIEQLQIEKKAIDDDMTAQAAMAKLEVELEKVQKEYQELEQIWRKHQQLLEMLRKYESRNQELSVLFENTKAKGDFDFAAKLQYQEIPGLYKKIAAVRTELDEVQEKHSWLRQVVGSIEIAEVIAYWCRVPVNKLLKNESQSLLTTEDRLRERVFGQDEALEVVAKAIKRSRVGVNDPSRPIGVFLFLGPTGVGKTETAKALAAEIFDDESRMVRIDMSEFMDQHNVARLIGAPPGYVGYGEGGELTEPVRRSPYTVVLFDEIEKAHPRILDILLQTFDDGRLTDGKGRLVDFRNTILIMTSNIPLNLTFAPGSEEAEEEKRSQLAGVLRPEFVGRIDEVVVFQRLGLMHFEHLLGKLLAQLNQRLHERQFRIEIGPKLKSLLIQKVAGGSFGGRALRRSFQSMVVDRVSERILAEPGQCIGAWKLECNEKGTYIWSIDDSLHRYLPAAE
ncbi:MAG: AAA family ATPase [Oligoflexales bacterium]|nr:AAA family ATPase [Oligoflexales bacterium]